MLKSFLYFLLSPLKIDKKNYIKMLVTSFFVGIYPGILATVLNIFVEKIEQGNRQAFKWIPVILLILLIKNLFSTYNSYWTGNFRDNIGKDRLKLVIGKFNRVNYSEVEREKNYDLLNRLGNKLDEEFFERTKSTLYAFEIILNYYSIVTFVLSVSLILGLVIGVLFIPLAYVGYKSGYEKYKTKKEVTSLKKRAEYYEKILTDKEFADEKCVFQYADAYREKWYETYKSYKGKEIRTKLLNSFNMEKTGIFANAIFAIGIFYLTLVGIDTGNFAPCVAMISQATVFSGNIRWGVMDLFQSLLDNKMYLKDWNNFFSINENQCKSSKKNREIVEICEIDFKDVSFAYPDTNHLILQNFCAHFEKGKTYAIVGENGSGKTTLTKLLLGLYDNYSGEIFINNIELRSIPKENLVSIFGVLFQDAQCYPLSIKDNIIRKSNTADIMGLLNHVGLAKKVQNLSKKENTVIGRLHEGDVEFSGGEKQRISIARLMAQKALVNILDEPTAAIDPAYEDEVNSLLINDFASDIKIIITHRLGIATKVDEIKVLSEGSIKEIGSHKQLMEKKGYYFEMFNKQKDWYDEKNQENHINNIE